MEINVIHNSYVEFNYNNNHLLYSYNFRRFIFSHSPVNQKYVKQILMPVSINYFQMDLIG